MPGMITEDQLDRQVEEKVQEKTQALQGEITQQQSVNASLAQQNAALNQQVTQMKPAWTNFADNFMNKFSLGTLWYFDYAMYTHPSFGPQFLTQINQPGPGNEILQFVRPQPRVPELPVYSDQGYYGSRHPQCVSDGWVKQ